MDYIGNYVLHNDYFKSTSDDSWKTLKTNQFFFYAVVTHEGMSSENEDILAPFARLNDGKMYLLTLEPMTRAAAIEFNNKIKSSDHVFHHKFSVYEASEIKFEHPEPVKFCIDGEVYQGKDITIQLLPA